MKVSEIARWWEGTAPELRSALRVVAALMFMSAGTMKLFAFPFGVPPHGGTVEAISELGLAGALETFGGVFILFGLFTRPVAFILSGEMAVAYFQVHLPRGAWPTANGGQPAVFYCFLWLYLSAAGAGPWSLDALRKK
jgi:putative oxidoreductase